MIEKAKFWEEYKSYDSSTPWYKRLLFAAEQWWYTRI
jgi:hypothetical protein